LQEVARALPLCPERTAAAGMAARQEQRPRSVLAEARGEQGGGAERLDHQILDFVRAGKEQLDFRRRVGFRHAEHHAVVRPHRLHLEPAILLETAHHGRGPRGMNPSAEWGQHAHAPVSHLVQVTLDDHRLIAGNLARGVGLVVQVLDEVRRRAFVEPVPLQPRQRLGFRGAGQLARQASDVHPELQGAAGSIAVPEGHLPRFAGRGSDDHLVLGDLLDPPAGSAEDEHVALSRLEDHLFIQLAHAPLLAASGLSGLQEHAIEAAIRNGSGVRDRHARRPLASAQRAAIRSQVRRGRSSANSSDGYRPESMSSTPSNELRGRSAKGAARRTSAYTSSTLCTPSAVCATICWASTSSGLRG